MEQNNLPARYHVLLLLLSLTLLPLASAAQVWPRDGAVLNYRLIGFSFPQHENTITYNVDIAKGVFNTNSEFEKNIILSRSSTTNRLVLTVPDWGSSYTWRYTFNEKNGQKTPQDLQHFATGYKAYIDSTKYRLRIINKATEHKDMLVMLDYAKTMYDMDGNPVWYLPDIPGIMDEVKPIRDLKPTPFGTFTFLSEEDAYEIDYNGTLLWKAPNEGTVSNDTSEFYHHEFTRINNGNYMLAGNEYVAVPMYGISDSLAGTIAHASKKEGIWYRKVMMGTLLEYTPDKKLVWKWHASQYFKNDSSFVAYIPHKPDDIAPHMNSFYLNDKTQDVYISFRNNNRILKIAYPSGKVKAVYNGNPGNSKDVYFRTQHAVSTTKEGYLLLFDNNFVMQKNGNTRSYIKLLKEGSKNTFMELWRFPCDIDTQASPYCANGGNVAELNDGCLITCMGTASRSFIVNKKKHIVWNAISESWNEQMNWHPFFQYRISYVENMNDMNKYIFFNDNIYMKK